ncbi:hypothetical protein D8B22_04470 [Verminephrobacter aporrectodeae subsp. tuberculatae]|nr:hypothetical protein [Verminephrobacter aporrectodeae subsp. tuberculatae]MCW8168393.1 hypothetical protein [Verminephrobacter aporrectodeae subsp. tuberculatae]
MARARQRVHHDHGSAGIAADPRSIMAAITDFRRSGRIDSFRDLKYVCLGIGALDGKGWSLLADETLRGIIARTVEQQSSEHRRLRCFQALLSAYFSFPVHGKDASPESATGWRGLRGWLRAERERLTKLSGFKPPWFDALTRHVKMLTAQPCEKFGADLLRGDASGLNDALDSLSIPQTSWVLEEAVLAQMTAASALRDGPFKSTLPDLLPIAMGHGGVSIGEGLKVRCVALLVSRYALCSDRPEQPALRDAATSTIGNPWLRRANWDAWVRSGNEPDDVAREMVFGWLKGRLITDFFELLTVDGTTDRRRLAYWLRFAPFVDDMWFALGTSAWRRPGAQFVEFRERAKGRLLNLEGATADNNAFVMRIGAYLAVEFGASGNAFYLFRWDALSPSLSKALTSGRAREGVRINELKADVNEDTMRHRDSLGALKSWEQKFDDRLTRLIGKKPEKRPACVPDLEALVSDVAVDVADLRNAGGALWVRETDRGSHLSRKLQAMGMMFRSGRGWFKE